MACGNDLQLVCQNRLFELCKEDSPNHSEAEQIITSGVSVNLHDKVCAQVAFHV